MQKYVFTFNGGSIAQKISRYKSFATVHKMHLLLGRFENDNLELYSESTDCLWLLSNMLGGTTDTYVKI